MEQSARSSDAAITREEAERELVAAYERWAHGPGDGRSSRGLLVRAAISLALILQNEGVEADA